MKTLLRLKDILMPWALGVSTGILLRAYVSDSPLVFFASISVLGLYLYKKGFFK